MMRIRLAPDWNSGSDILKNSQVALPSFKNVGADTGAKRVDPCG